MAHDEPATVMAGFHADTLTVSTTERVDLAVRVPDGCDSSGGRMA